MSVPEPRESIWRRLLHSQDDRYVRLRFLCLMALLVAGALLVPKLIDGFTELKPVSRPAPPPGLPPAAHPNAGLVIESSELDFGEVPERPWLDVSMTLRNPTERDVVIDGWLGEDRFEIDPPRLTVPAHGLTEIRAHFDPIFGRKTTEVFDVVEIYRPFQPEIPAEPGSHLGWTLTGRVQRAVSVSTDSLELSEKPLRRGGEFPTKLVEVLTLCPIKSLEAEYDQSVLLVEVSGPDVGNRYRLSVRPAETIPAGAHTVPVLLRAELREGGVAETDFQVIVVVK